MLVGVDERIVPHDVLEHRNVILEKRAAFHLAVDDIADLHRPVAAGKASGVEWDGHDARVHLRGEDAGRQRIADMIGKEVRQRSAVGSGFPSYGESG